MFGEVHTSEIGRFKIGLQSSTFCYCSRQNVFAMVFHQLKKTNITSTALKFCDLTEDVMT